MAATLRQIIQKAAISFLHALILVTALSGCASTRPFEPQPPMSPNVVYMSELEWRTGAVVNPQALAKQSKSYLTGRNSLVWQTFDALAATSRTLVPHPLHIGSRPARAWLTVDENGGERMACLEIASTSGSLTMAFDPPVQYPALVWQGRGLLLNAHVNESERYLLLNPHSSRSDTLYWVSLEDDHVDVTNLMPALLPDAKNAPASVTVVAKNLDSEFLSLCLGVKSNDAPFATVRRYMKVGDIENWCRRGRRSRFAAPEAGLLVEPATTEAGPNDKVGIPQSIPKRDAVVLAGTSGKDVVETPWQEDEKRRAWEKSMAAWQTGTFPRPLLPVPRGLRATDPAIVAWEGANADPIRYLDLWQSGKAARLEFVHGADYPFRWISPNCALILPDVHDHGLWRQVLLVEFRKGGIFLTDVTKCLPHLGNEGAIDAVNVADQSIKLVTRYRAQPGWQYYRCVYTIPLTPLRQASGFPTQWVKPGSVFMPEGWFYLEGHSNAGDEAE